jgi:hypothetical protein
MPYDRRRERGVGAARRAAQAGPGGEGRRAARRRAVEPPRRAAHLDGGVHEVVKVIVMVKHLLGLGGGVGWGGVGWGGGGVELGVCVLWGWGRGERPLRRSGRAAQGSKASDGSGAPLPARRAGGWPG